VGAANGAKWRAGMGIGPLVGDGSALEAAERTKRAERPWLYTGAVGGEPEAISLARLAAGVPLAVKLGVAIGKARRRDHLANASALAQSAVEQGLIDAAVHHAINDAAETRQAELAWWRGYWAKLAPSRATTRLTDSDRRPRTRHRQRLALSGPLPPDLGQHFTVGQCAILKIVADEVWRRGTCGLSKKEIGDRAQASETVVHQTFRKAVSKGLLKVKVRPRRGQKNLPNLITVIDAQWLGWIYRPKYRAIREDREIEAEAHHKAQLTQGAQRRTPYTDIYTKNADGVWNSQEVGDQKPTTILMLRAAGPP
jgi:hypothetical protein